MFSGIVQTKAKITKICSGLLSLESAYFEDNSFDHGASILVSGVCLSLVKQEAKTVSFEMLSVTLEKTIFSKLNIGDLVNIEPSLKLSSTLDGHLVTGHVDRTLEVLSIDCPDKLTTRVCFRLPSEYRKFVSTKCSVCISGVSLTVGEVFQNSFEVFLVPVTREKTTLGSLKIGDLVNFEVDTLARYVCNYLENRDS